ncbi:MAG: hypothetical protein K6F39_03440 [Lachnospiraceae bacterium]|nr:hypothetical protein [Lachnospiraceae bacterium]
MAKQEFQKGSIIHVVGDTADTVDILLKGKVGIGIGDNITISAGNGTILDVFMSPGETYDYPYVAYDDCTIYSYDFRNESDIIKIIKINASMAPVLASANIRFAKQVLDNLALTHKKGFEVYQNIKKLYKEYEDLCDSLGEEPDQFESVDRLPEPPENDSEWIKEILDACAAKDAVLRKSFYGLDVSFCVAAIMTCGNVVRKTRKELEKADMYIELANESTADFMKAYNRVKKRTEARENGEADVVDEDISDALEDIISYSGVEGEVADRFRDSVLEFRSITDKNDTSDDMRKLRRTITKDFYTIYESAFFKAQEDSKLPLVMKMFFMYGFVDTELAGKENAEELKRLAIRWKSDPEGRILTAYEWLQRIYKLEDAPSKNEFDNDWPAYLREEKRSGNLSDSDVNSMLDDPKARAAFELNNMIQSANRMTSGTITTFVPVFHAGEVIRPLDATIVTPKKAKEQMAAVTNIDFGCFYRETVTSYPELKMNQFRYSTEVLPYLILMPNCGSRVQMWQEIEGRKRTTRGRMVMSLYYMDDIETAMIELCGQFRWEMCKTIQGVHWNDVTDPSLTAEYSDYLQFYKKNHDISPDTREKIKNQLQKARNNSRGVFVQDYLSYIRNESKGQSKLNKVAREMLFKYCTFGKDIRSSMAQNPQYQSFIERYEIKNKQELHSLALIIHKVEGMTEDIPEEILKQKDYLQL